MSSSTSAGASAAGAPTPTSRFSFAGSLGSSDRALSYLARLPALTRVFLLLVVVVWLLGLQSTWDVRQTLALVPDELSFAAAYRLNTYPFVHLNLFHMLMNALALTPLLERFELEYGTLTALAVFLGPFSTFPGLMYYFLEKHVLGLNTAVMGASVWVFLLLAMEAMRTFRTNPRLDIGPVHVPTWTTPLILALVVAVLVPSSSLLGHLCGLAVGYLAGLGYVKFLAPPEKALRWAEGKLKLRSRLGPAFISVDQKTYGRFGVLPSSHGAGATPSITYVGSTQRLGP